jgi:hypothetical protein
MASPQQKNDTPPGGGNWSKLETPGDVRRYLRWLILQTKTDKVDVRKAGVMGQLGLYLLKTLEVSNLEVRLTDLEHRLERTQENQKPHEFSDPHTTH